MIRQIIRIDRERCNGCGACDRVCHEGAIEMIGGKAVLVREDYCDGLGDCLPACPTNAIRFEMREAPAYDEAAVLQAKARKNPPSCPPQGCPGSRPKVHVREREQGRSWAVNSCLNQWPCQIRLAPVQAPYYEQANLLIAADCTAFAYGNFHQEFMRGHVTLIGCPKLDGVDYADKLTQIIAGNQIKSVRILRMEVPCCGGLENAVKRALQQSGKFIPWQIVTISTEGKVLE